MVIYAGQGVFHIEHAVAEAVEAAVTAGAVHFDKASGNRHVRPQELAYGQRGFAAIVAAHVAGHPQAQFPVHVFQSPPVRRLRSPANKRPVEFPHDVVLEIGIGCAPSDDGHSAFTGEAGGYILRRLLHRVREAYAVHPRVKAAFAAPLLVLRIDAEAEAAAAARLRRRCKLAGNRHVRLQGQEAFGVHVPGLVRSLRLHAPVSELSDQFLHDVLREIRAGSFPGDNHAASLRQAVGYLFRRPLYGVFKAWRLRLGRLGIHL